MILFITTTLFNLLLLYFNIIILLYSYSLGSHLKSFISYINKSIFNFSFIYSLLDFYNWWFYLLSRKFYNSNFDETIVESWSLLKWIEIFESEQTLFDLKLKIEREKLYFSKDHLTRFIIPFFPKFFLRFLGFGKLTSRPESYWKIPNRMGLREIWSNKTCQRRHFLREQKHQKPENRNSNHLQKSYEFPRPEDERIWRLFELPKSLLRSKEGKLCSCKE